MKCATYLLVIALSVAVSINMNPATLLSKKFFNLKDSKASASNEDIKFCGSYASECMNDEGMSSKASMKILGMMHKDPIYLQYPGVAYMGADCKEESKIMTTTMNAAMKPANGVEKTINITPEKFTLIIHSELMISQLTCKTPLEVNVEYNIADLECTMGGMDPFEDMKKMIGEVIPQPFTFNEDSVEIKGDEPIVLKRESDIGCTCVSDLLKKSVSMLPINHVAAPREDVKFCGTYATGCQSTEIMSIDASMKILGMMHKDPIYLQYPATLFIGNQCTDETKLMTLTLNGGLKTVNEDRKEAISVEKITFVGHNELLIAQYKCTIPLEVNKEYNVMDLDCKDESGEDPFKDVKSQVGTTTEYPFKYSENSVIVTYPESGDTEFKRESDIGCTCANTNRLRNDICMN